MNLALLKDLSLCWPTKRKNNLNKSTAFLAKKVTKLKFHNRANTIICIILTTAVSRLEILHKGCPQYFPNIWQPTHFNDPRFSFLHKYLFVCNLWFTTYWLRTFIMDGPSPSHMRILNLRFFSLVTMPQTLRSATLFIYCLLILIWSSVCLIKM